MSAEGYWVDWCKGPFPLGLRPAPPPHQPSPVGSASATLLKGRVIRHLLGARASRPHPEPADDSTPASGPGSKPQTFFTPITGNMVYIMPRNRARSLVQASRITPPLRGSRREGAARSRAGGGQTPRPVDDYQRHAHRLSKNTPHGARGFPFGELTRAFPFASICDGKCQVLAAVMRVKREAGAIPARSRHCKQRVFQHCNWPLLFS